MVQSLLGNSLTSFPLVEGALQAPPAMVPVHAAAATSEFTVESKITRHPPSVGEDRRRVRYFAAAAGPKPCEKNREAK